jgi:hypothetical protein
MVLDEHVNHRRLITEYRWLVPETRLELVQQKEKKKTLAMITKE